MLLFVSVKWQVIEPLSANKFISIVNNIDCCIFIDNQLGILVWII